jgi:hypothetical protein
MFKKIIISVIVFMFFMPSVVFAGVGSAAMVGGKYYETLEDAIKAAGSNDTIKLVSDVKLDDTLDINKTVDINLNGKDITGPEKVFKVKGGVLNLTGTGTIRETKPNYGAIAVIGSTDSSDKDYSIVNIGSGVKLEGWSGIFITHDSNKSYGVVVNLDGDITAVNDTNGDTGIGVYVNGNIKDEKNHPVVNIGDDAEITSTGNGLYIAGYATFNIKGAYIEGDESGIGIKSGILNIDGATIYSEGIDKTPTGGYNNGIKASGTGIQIESNSGYTGNMEINIDSGTIRSKNSYAVYEYIGKGTDSMVDSIDISGGTFRAEGNKEDFGLSDSFKSMHGSFISGGRYTSNPSGYLEAGYSAKLENDLYVVTASSSKLVSGDTANSDGGSSILKILATIVIIGIAIVLMYMNRNSILSLFRK